MDDYVYFDPPLWLGVLFLYVLPIFVNLNGCLKNKRKLIPSIFVSIIYPTGIWSTFLLWLGAVFIVINLANKITFLSGGIAVFLGFLLATFLMIYPCAHLANYSNNIFYNYKNKGIFSFKNEDKNND